MFDSSDDKSIYIDQDFSNIQFPNGEIHSKEFESCLFQGCNLSETAFIHCKFNECKFINCNLSLITVKGCSFFEVVFEDTKAIGINWTQASWPRIKLSSPLQFHQSNLTHSSFFGLYLRDFIARECNLKEVDFREADLTEADFSHSDFSNSLFGRTKLIKANFYDATNYNIDIFSNEIKNAKFSLPDALNLLNCLEIEIV